jgi:hypothetical protein
MALLFEQIPKVKGPQYQGIWTNLLRQARCSSSTDLLKSSVDEVSLWLGTFKQELFVKQMRASDITIGVSIVLPNYYLKYFAWLTQSSCDGKVTGFRAESNTNYFSPALDRNLCRQEITEHLDRFHFGYIYDNIMLQAAANALELPITHSVHFGPALSRGEEFEKRGYETFLESGEKVFIPQLVQSRMNL